jgi:hypothetical protein
MKSHMQGYAHEHVQTRQFEFIVRILFAGIVQDEGMLFLETEFGTCIC